jgi:hypothetical protein
MCKVNRSIAKVLLVSLDAKVDCVSSTPRSCAEFKQFFLFNKYSLRGDAPDPATLSQPFL